MRFLLALLALLVSAPAWAAPITLAWDANPPGENVVAYRIGDCAPSTLACTSAGETALTQFTLDVPLSSSKCFRVLAVNAYGLTSEWSSEVCMQPTKPSAVNAWRVILYVPR
jgi:hypothetical protein